MKLTKNYIDKEYVAKRSELLKHCLYIEVDVKAKLLDFMVNIASLDLLRDNLIDKKKVVTFNTLLKKEKILKKEALFTYIVSTSMFDFISFLKLINNRLFQKTLTHDQSKAYKRLDLVRKVRNSVSHTRKCHKSHLLNVYNNIVKPNIVVDGVFDSVTVEVKKIRKMLK